MIWIWWICGVLAGAAWVWHVIDGGLGMEKVARLHTPEWDLPVSTPPSVSIIVPARNEEKTIEPALQSLAALDYPNYEIVVIDDRSEDGTGAIVERVAADHQKGDARRGRSPLTSIRVLHVEELPAGWLGKTHAMWRGALDSQGEWLLFTDADVQFRPDTLRRVMAYAERDVADHYVLFPTMIFHSFGERMVMAFFAIMFGFANKPWKVADPKARDHVGMGAFNLVRRSVYDKVGGYEHLRLAVIDDVKLGEMVKRAGGAQRAVFGWNLIRLHWAAGAVGILHNLTKNFFAQVRFSLLLAVLATMAMLFFNWAPYVGTVLAPGWAKAPYVAGIVAIALIYAGVQREEPGTPWYLMVTHPLAAVLVAYAVLRSAFVTLKDGGITWRGTKYSLQELRDGMK